MPILKGAKEVHIDRCDFQDVRGNYYDYRSTTNGLASGTDYSRVGGKTLVIVDVGG